MDLNESSITSAKIGVDLHNLHDHDSIDDLLQWEMAA